MRRICSIGTVTEIFPNVIISLIVTLTILKIESWAFNIGRVGRRVGNWFQNLWGNSHLLLQNILRRILVQGRGDLKKLQHKADFTNRCRKFPHIILKLVGLLGRVWESYNPAALWEHWLGGRLPYVVREGDCLSSGRAKTGDCDCVKIIFLNQWWCCNSWSINNSVH